MCHRSVITGTTRTGKVGSSRSGGKLQQAFATPNADDSHPCRITPVHDAKRRMDEFPQEGLIEFGHHPSHIRMVGQRLDTLEHLLQ